MTTIAVNERVKELVATIREKSLPSLRILLSLLAFRSVLMTFSVRVQVTETLDACTGLAELLIKAFGSDCVWKV